MAGRLTNYWTAAAERSRGLPSLTPHLVAGGVRKPWSLGEAQQGYVCARARGR